MQPEKNAAFFLGGGREAEKRTRICELVKKELWSAKKHPARSRDAAQLYESLLRTHEEMGRTHMMHKQEGQLHIFHYGAVVQNAGHWDADALLARGLIFQRDEGTQKTSLVATPWPKFFNLGEDGLQLPELAASVEGGGWVEVTSKMDGSLGLLFHHEESWRCTTKGSFESPQGVWATKWVAAHCDTEAALVPGTTYLVEIIYPENKIVIPCVFLNSIFPLAQTSGS
jgi:RNA ligase